MPLVSVRIKVLYHVWRKRGVEANFQTLRDALHYRDERQLRDIIPELVTERLLKVEHKEGRPDRWVITRAGINKIRFLTFPYVLNYLFAVIGISLITFGLSSYLGLMPVAPVGEIGLGLAVMTFVILIMLTRRDFEAELFRVEGQG
jgi:hypothetical protein